MPSDVQKKAAPGPGGAQEEAADEVEALSVRYRFVERYSLAPDPAHPELVNQYRVGTRDTLKVMQDKLQGTPDRSERTLLTFYTERVAQVNRLGGTMSTVRRYDKVKGGNTARASEVKPPFLEGLQILYGRRPRQKPEVLSLVDSRPLREAEYAMICQEVFLPQLGDLLPRTAVRVDDVWPIPRDVARSLWSELDDSKEYELTGSLLRVTKAASGHLLTAVIGIQGQFWVADSPSAFNSEISFTFALPDAGTTAGGTTEKSKDAGSRAGSARARTEKGVVEARGWISRAVMSQVLVRLIDVRNSRLKQTTTRELDVHRLAMADALKATGNDVAPVEVPSPLPVASEANSWLSFEDPAGRLRFRHPQQLEMKPPDVADVELVNSASQGGHDVLTITLKPRGQDSTANEAFRDPEQLKRIIEERWAKLKVEATRGPAGWLRQEEPAASRRRVYRIESAVNNPDGRRIYVDDYLVVLNPARSVAFSSWTEREDHVGYRNQVESVIKSFQIGATERRSGATPAPPTSAPTPSQ